MTSDEQKRHIYQAVTFFHPKKGTVFELCGLGPGSSKSRLWEGYAGGKKGVVAGWFDDPIKATESAAAMDAQGFEGIYITLNPTNQALLSRAANRLKAGVARTQDGEIIKLRRLLIDIDPKRPAGVPSSNGEHEAACNHAVWMRRVLSSKGWPQPLFGDSGNGAHLIYDLPDLENNEKNISLLKETLAALNELYSVAVGGQQGYIHLDIDAKVFNPARICKLYGTHARKGDDTKERPHRQARIIEIPKDRRTVTVEGLKAIITEAQKDDQQSSRRKESGKRAHDRQTPNEGFDLTRYLQHYGVIVKTLKDHGGSTLHVLDTCLFDETHAGGESSIGQTTGGKLFYQCFHDSCKGRTWHDARQKISGGDKLSQFCRGFNFNTSGTNGDGKDWTPPDADDLLNRSKSILSEFDNPLEEYDTRNLPPLLATFVDYVACTTGANKITILISFLCVLSGFIKKRLYIPETDFSKGVHGYFQTLYMNIWAVVVSASGTFKTTALNKGARFGFAKLAEIRKEIARIKKEYDAEIQQDGLSKDSTNKKKARDRAIALVEKGTPFLPNRSTAEGLIEHLAHGYAGTILCSEFGEWLANLEKTHNTGLKALLTDFYDVPESYSYKTRTNGLMTVERPFISIAGVSTAEWVNANINPTDISAGFFARFLLLLPPPKKQIPDALPKWKEGIDHGVIDQIKAVIGTIPDNRAYSLSEGAACIFEEFHEGMYRQFYELNDHMQGILDPYLKRWSPYVLKLSIAMQLFIDKDARQIGPEAVVSAISIVEYAIRSTTFLFQHELGESEHQRQQRLILEFVAKRGGSAKWLEIIGSKKLSGGSKEYADVVQTLVESGRLNEQKTTLKKDWTYFLDTA